jgi:hypothetical protein
VSAPATAATASALRREDVSEMWQLAVELVRGGYEEEGIDFVKSRLSMNVRLLYGVYSFSPLLVTSSVLPRLLNRQSFGSCSCRCTSAGALSSGLSHSD